MSIITFPRDLPAALRFVEWQFDPMPQEELTPLRSGKVIAKDLGPMFWALQARSRILTETELGVARAFFATVRSINEFHVYDMLREYPLAYRDTHWAGLTWDASPFDGTCQLVDVAENNVEIDLEELPDGFVLNIGDYLSFDYGEGDATRALHQVVAAATANSSGEMTVEVRPNIRPGWEFEEPATGRTVQLYRPAARMILEPGSWQAPTERGRRGRISFRAIQTL